MITEKDIADAFNAAGITTIPALTDVIAGLSKSLALKRVEIRLSELQEKRGEVLAPIENQRIELENQRALIVGEIRSK